jgi:DNA adenine methylase Dam
MIIKSPIFYMGNKYDLMQNLLMYFPKKEEVNLFIDLFGGSGVVSINVPYNNVIYNEINNNIVELFKMLIETPYHKIIEHIYERMNQFDLPKQGTDIRQNVKGVEIKRKQANESYLKYRKFYNDNEKNYLDLYALTYFSFCNLIRFNKKNEFNMPFGNRTFTKEHEIEIELFHRTMVKKDVEILNEDSIEYLKSIKSNVGQFIYLDPPYLNTMAIYNENRAFGGWNIEHDYKMFKELDRLNALGIKWALSNVLENKGIRNTHLEKWALEKGYTIIDFENKQYASLGKGNAKSQEVLIINYKAPFERISIFDL